jgi:hypothetical protein
VPKPVQAELLPASHAAAEAAADFTAHDLASASSSGSPSSSSSSSSPTITSSSSSKPARSRHKVTQYLVTRDLSR